MQDQKTRRGPRRPRRNTGGASHTQIDGLVIDFDIEQPNELGTIADFRRFLDSHRFLEDDLDQSFWAIKDAGRLPRAQDVERIFNACAVPDTSEFSAAEVVKLWPKYQEALNDSKMDWSQTAGTRKRKPPKEPDAKPPKHNFIIRQRSR